MENNTVPLHGWSTRSNLRRPHITTTNTINKPQHDHDQHGKKRRTPSADLSSYHLHHPSSRGVFVSSNCGLIVCKKFRKSAVLEFLRRFVTRRLTRLTSAFLKWLRMACLYVEALAYMKVWHNWFRLIGATKAFLISWTNWSEICLIGSKSGLLAGHSADAPSSTQEQTVIYILPTTNGYKVGIVENCQKINCQQLMVFAKCAKLPYLFANRCYRHLFFSHSSVLCILHVL